MKHMLKTIVKTVKSAKGNSLAEFATTTALMATLAATAAPKLSEMSEGTKGEKSRNEIDKIIKQAGQFYQDTADSEGRGRFPNQTKFNVAIGGGDYDNAGGSTSDLEAAKAASAQHTADIMDAKARLSDYFENPVAIGEHPQHTEEIDKLIGQLEDATGKLEALSENFGKEYGHDIPVSEEDEKQILKG